MGPHDEKSPRYPDDGPSTRWRAGVTNPIPGHAASSPSEPGSPQAFVDDARVGGYGPTNVDPSEGVRPTDTTELVLWVPPGLPHGGRKSSSRDRTKDRASKATAILEAERP